MKTNRKVTTVLLLATLAAAGCSQDGDKSTGGQQNPVQLKPVSMITESPAPVPTGDAKLTEAKPTITGPASFADGEAAYKSGNYSDATKVFEQYTGEKPENAWGHFMLGLSASKGGDTAKAEKGFEEALRIDPKHVKSMVNLSRVLIAEKRYEDALSKLTSAAELEPNNADVQRLLGRTYHSMGKSDDAVTAYRKAIELNGKDAWSMNNLGFLFLEQGRYNDALPLLTGAVALEKNVPMFHNNLGMALEHTGRFTAAVEAYKGALSADSGYEKARQNLARVEAVKVGKEEPIDLTATTKPAGEEKQVPVEKSAADR